jgi:methylmalonyl-CoA mutase N-terminal domain/subunit
MGGSVKAIEQDYIQQEIAAAAYQHQQEIENLDQILVGVNQFVQPEEQEIEVFRVDDSIRLHQIGKLQKLKAQRDNAAVEKSLHQLEDAAKGNSNLMPYILSAVENYATLGEIADAMRRVFGEH